MCSAVAFVLGALTMGLAPCFAAVVLGRFVSGIGVGLCGVVNPIYLTEMAPPRVPVFPSNTTAPRTWKKDWV